MQYGFQVFLRPVDSLGGIAHHEFGCTKILSVFPLFSLWTKGHDM